MRLTNDNYVTEAEKAIKILKNKKEEDRRKNLVTTTKIRGLLSMLSDIYNEIQSNPAEQLSPDVCARISYLKVRFLYEAGKDKNGRDYPVKEFVETAHILEYLEGIKGKRSEFMLFYHYMEALIAYFKYFGLDKE